MASEIMEYFLAHPKNFREMNCPIFYGKCDQIPNVEKNLWFVKLDKFFWEKIWDTGWDQPFPFDHHIFLVDEKYTSPEVMNSYRTDAQKWASISQKTYVGQWCQKYEILWQDIPVFSSQKYPSIKYGYCRTQSSKHPERELWYVSFMGGSTFVVDKYCTTDEFIGRMGYDVEKWISICWCHLQDEVTWEELETGTLGGGYVRDREFILDSPFKPESIEAIEQKISEYETKKGK